MTKVIARSELIARSERGSKPAQRASGRDGSDMVVVKGVSPGDGHNDLATAEERRQCRIAEAAYVLAERRGFACGYELDDWLTAERDIDAALAQEESGIAPTPAAGREG